MQLHARLCGRDEQRMAKIKSPWKKRSPVPQPSGSAPPLGPAKSMFAMTHNPFKDDDDDQDTNVLCHAPCRVAVEKAWQQGRRRDPVRRLNTRERQARRRVPARGGVPAVEAYPPAGTALKATLARPNRLLDPARLTDLCLRPS